jgi:hypothetical protein
MCFQSSSRACTNCRSNTIAIMCVARVPVRPIPASASPSTSTLSQWLLNTPCMRALAWCFYYWCYWPAVPVPPRLISQARKNPINPTQKLKRATSRPKSSYDNYQKHFDIWPILCILRMVFCHITPTKLIHTH